MTVHMEAIKPGDQHESIVNSDLHVKLINTEVRTGNLHFALSESPNVTTYSLFFLTWPLDFAPVQCYNHQFRDNSEARLRKTDYRQVNGYASNKRRQ